MKELHSYFDEYNYTEALHQALKEMYAKYEVVEGPIAEDDPVRHWDPANPEHMVALVNPVQNSKSQNPHTTRLALGQATKRLGGGLLTKAIGASQHCKKMTPLYSSR